MGSNDKQLNAEATKGDCMVMPDGTELLSKSEALEELALMFEYWLKMNEREFDETPSDDAKVIPPEWPSRGVIKIWIFILRHENHAKV